MNSTDTGRQERALQEIGELIASARSGTLATLMEGGGPYASLVNVARFDGTPVMLLSRLAWHTRNILNDSRACLLIGGAAQSSQDLLAGPRVSLIGRACADNDDRLRESYLTLHPNARSYANFADFTCFRLNVEIAHYVAGFGQIITIEKPQLHSQAVESP
jgi:putative heme iron utilization protein